MKLEKAIEILTNLGKGVSPYIYYETLEAAALGTEALKRIELQRYDHIIRYGEQLPGETD